jgi:hypothetical protein
MSPTKLDYVWVIAYINRDHISRVEDDLLDRGFGAIRVYIPTVRILKKQFKNRNIYEYVPLLFNYGFFQLPYHKACDVEFLRQLREEIPAIYAWVVDPVKVLKDNPHLRFDNKEAEEEEEEELAPGELRKLKKIEQTPNVATAKEEEIVSLLKAAETMSVFSDGIIDQLQEGSFITLQGYPYEGMPAEIVDINKVKKVVKVRLLLETMITTATVSFENIFYTVYSDYDKKLKEKSLEEIGEKGKRNLDKIYAKIGYGEN